MKKIQKESEIVWKTLFKVLILPITLILVLFGKRKVKELTEPFRDVILFIFQPKFTITIIIINVCMYVIRFFLSSETLNSLVLRPSNLIELNFLPFISSGFLHANIGHLIGNMIALFVFGRVIERKIGMAKTAYVYFGALILSGVFSSLIHLFIIHDNVAGIGASGAVMGFVATAILLDPLYTTYIFIIPTNIMLLGWVTIAADITGILNPIEDGIGHFAHLGGFISIALLMFALSRTDRKELKKGLFINMISLLIGITVFFIYINFF